MRICTFRFLLGVGRVMEDTRMKKAPLVAEPLHHLKPLDLSGDDTCGGAQAVGNACDALG